MLNKKEFVMIDRQRRQKSIEMLGFDPYTQDYGAWVGPNGEILWELNKERAEYLLKYHNFDNRNFKDSQLKELDESVLKFGYQNDGDPLRVNKDGNIPEYQHRLKTVINRNLTVFIPVVLGVEPGAWTKTAKAAARTNYDEIWRKDKSVTGDEVSTLSEIVLRLNFGIGKKHFKQELKLHTASSLWVEYKDTVRAGERIIIDFFDGTKVWNPWRRTFSAWAGLMWKHGREKDATMFLKWLKLGTLGKETTPLVMEFKKVWEQEDSSYLKNTARPRTIWFMLCKASDMISENPDGECQFVLGLTDCNHNAQKRNGQYRKFHRNPDNIGATPVLNRIAA